MKKKILFIMVGTMAALSFAARTPKVKQEIEIVKLGKFDPVELGSGTFRLRKIFAWKQSFLKINKVNKVLFLSKWRSGLTLSANKQSKQ